MTAHVLNVDGDIDCKYVETEFQVKRMVPTSIRPKV